MSDLIYYLVPVLLVAVAMRWHVGVQSRRSRLHDAALREAQEAGLTEPPSLHPVLDPALCVGSGGCARACPEQALGIIGRKGVLINPTHCIGHGACAAACPVGAIKLVFGTARRGVEIPQLSPDFETNLPGVFIAGELGGMGLIRNATKQGRQAIDAIARRPRGAADYDVVIVGAGPAGITASLAAGAARLKYVTIEQEDALGGTTYHYPRNKLVMTAPLQLPGIGEIKVREVSKEQLMGIWQRVLDEARPAIHFSERMEEIVPDGAGFVVRTSKGSYRAASVLLAIGRRGTPRKLGAPGEEHPKVVYRLIEATQYAGQRVLVVGGGDSALEAALAIGAEPGTTVTLAYRGKAFDRVKPQNRERLDAAASAGRVAVLLDTTVERIDPDQVTLKTGAASRDLDNDAIVVCAGGELPTPMLKRIGIKVEAHYGT